MKKKFLVKAVALVCGIIMCALLFCSCDNKLTLKEGKIYCENTGAMYTFVSSVYLPKSISTEAYAVYTYNKIKMNYYQIEGLEPTEWLISEGGDLIYAGADALPNLTGFKAVEMYVAYNYDTPLSIIHETDLTKVASIVERFDSGDVVDTSLYDFTTYKVLFVSEEYPAFYYQLKLRVTDSAKYLCDISSGIIIDVTELFSDYEDLNYSGDEYEG